MERISDLIIDLKFILGFIIWMGGFPLFCLVGLGKLFQKNKLLFSIITSLYAVKYYFVPLTYPKNWNSPINRVLHNLVMPLFYRNGGKNVYELKKVEGPTLFAMFPHGLLPLFGLASW